MSRQGASIEQLELLLDRFGPGEPLRLEAVMTHFHSPQNEEATQKQERAFAQGGGDHRQGVAFDRSF